VKKKDFIGNFTTFASKVDITDANITRKKILQFKIPLRIDDFTSTNRLINSLPSVYLFTPDAMYR
jgi:hypothetical protein